jgi:hypothetical protein
MSRRRWTHSRRRCEQRRPSRLNRPLGFRLPPRRGLLQASWAQRRREVLELVLNYRRAGHGAPVGWP